MSFTIVQNDPSAAKLTGASRHGMKEASGGNNGEQEVFTDDFGDRIVAVVGRGETDRNITYIALKNTSSVLCYIYPNAAGTGIIVTPTLP